MSSHREAPEISKDPVADNTDVYAFVSPDRPDTVTLIANYVPLQEPAGGPNFYEFGEDVLYEIHIDNDADAKAEITYQFRFRVEVRNPDTFLYNRGTITSLTSPNWNRPQFYSVTKIEHGQATVLAQDLLCPPCNIGPHSTPNYPELAAAAIHTLPNGEKVFAGQRAEGFYVDLGAIFDLLDLRPFQNLHIMPMMATNGVDAAKHLNVHSIALQVPITHLTSDGSRPTSVNDPHAVLGIWATASRQKVKMNGSDDAGNQSIGPWMQVSRLANPLINEVIIAMGDKDRWNRLQPADDKQFVEYYQHPEVSRLLPVLYPGVFPHLARLTAVRQDVIAILLTGIPKGLIPGFQNFTGSTLADLLRLNVAIAPTPIEKANIDGILAGDLAGFPNGRRVFDDVVAIELRVLAGVTYPLINPKFEPDKAATVLDDGVTRRPESYEPHFPYLNNPHSGFTTPSD
jgi:hypothetical protein